MAATTITRPRTSGLEHLEPYLLAPSSLTPTALRERAEIITAEIVAAGGADALLADCGGEPIALRGNFLYDAWLLPTASGVSDPHTVVVPLGTATLVVSSPPSIRG